jgi:hypothetical protein
VVHIALIACQHSLAKSKIFLMEQELFMVCKTLFGLCVGEQAQALGAEFGQNAIVWADADAVPQLILLR